MCSCISFDCKKFQECALSSINREKSEHCVAWGSFGSGNIDSTGVEIEYACGEEGNYKMFIPSEPLESF